MLLDTFSQFGPLIPPTPSIGEDALNGITGGQFSDPDESVNIANPGLFFESATFGFLDRETAEDAGVPESIDLGDIRDGTAGTGGSSGSSLRLFAFVIAFSAVAYAVGQLFTFEVGS